MNKEIKVTGCFHSCPFFVTSMYGMYCDHPHWDDKGMYDKMIINQDNSRDGYIPEQCPLKEESVTIKYTLEKDD